MTDEPAYFCISPEQPLPDISGYRPFKAVLILERETPADWRSNVAAWLVAAGCRYAMTWGIDNEAWHDEIDDAVHVKFDWEEVPDDHFIMTTWHENLDETFWFAQFCAYFSYDDVELTNTLLVHVADAPSAETIVARFRAAPDWEE
ncbi:MAG TPA: hypothetical protein VHM92_07530 [Allosphingosinicella sp.]|nr:hypothetical protein [Allosphingosinicella sp.]